jgi:c-di-GMP-binding flagellar brake protein YcgR
MDTSTYFLFEQAVANGDEADAAVQINDGNQSFKIQFIDRTDDGFWLNVSAISANFANQIAIGGTPIVFQLGVPGACATFTAKCTRFDPQHSVDGVPVRAIYCHAPDEVSLVQRRQFFRSSANPKVPIAITAWKVPAHWVLRDKPKPSSQLRVDLIDISNGGLCAAILPNKTGPDSVATRDRIRIELRFEEAEALLDGELIYQQPPELDRPFRAGIAFRKLDSTIEGRRALFVLDRVIAALQRLAIKETSAA